MAKLVERWLPSPEIQGSNPVTAQFLLYSQFAEVSINLIKQMVWPGFEPRSAEWKAHTNPLALTTTILAGSSFLPFLHRIDHHSQFHCINWLRFGREADGSCSRLNSAAFIVFLFPELYWRVI